MEPDPEPANETPTRHLSIISIPGATSAEGHRQRGEDEPIASAMQARRPINGAEC
jgi:hypothetical protein